MGSMVLIGSLTVCGAVCACLCNLNAARNSCLLFCVSVPLRAGDAGDNHPARPAEGSAGFLDWPLLIAHCCSCRVFCSFKLSHLLVP